MNGSLGRNKDDLHLGSNNDCSCLYAWIHVHFDRAGRHDGGWSCEMVYIYIYILVSYGVISDSV